MKSEATALCAALAFGVAFAAPVPAEFAWRAALELPAGAAMARVSLPAQALLRLQSFDARDLRVFNAAGEAVPFTLVNPGAATPPAPSWTASFPAFGLLSGAPGKKPGKGAVSVRIDEAGVQRSVWVRLSGGDTGSSQAGANQPAAQDGTALPSAIFTTRDAKQTLNAIKVVADLPANQPVLVTAASSADLSQWTPLPLRGRLYRFEGAGAPSNDTLEFEQPLSLEGRYLRLDWQGHEGVKLRSIQGRVAPAQAAPQLVRTPLPAPTQAGPALLEWRLDFATTIATLGLTTSRANTLVPVRILGRNEAGQPWRQIGQTVLYRLGSGAKPSVNPATPLNASVRWLRVEAGPDQSLDAKTIQASVEFQPVQLVFIASGGAPFTLAAGRADTAPAAMPNATFNSAMPGDLNQAPLAAIGNALEAAPAGRPSWLAHLPGGLSGRDLALWAALLGGVALLGAVAFTLLRQLKSARTDAPPPNSP